MDAAKKSAAAAVKAAVEFADASPPPPASLAKVSCRREIIGGGFTWCFFLWRREKFMWPRLLVALSVRRRKSSCVAEDGRSFSFGDERELRGQDRYLLVFSVFLFLGDER